MELSLLNIRNRWYWLVLALPLLISCEKEIHVKLPASEPSLVVEGCINNTIQSLNYVYVSQTVDYFNPNLSLLGISDANVYVTEGVISGTDTTFDPSNRVEFFSLTLPDYPSGVYLNPTFIATAEKVYKLEVIYQGKTVTGITQIPDSTAITEESIQISGERDGKPQGYLSFTFFDPPGPSYYRIATTVNKFSNMLGFGEAYQIRRIDDSNLDNQVREYSFTQPYTEGDTVNLYLCRLGVREYKFWESFASAENNAGPFATPVQLKSTLNGAIGCFSGYNIDYKRVIIQ